ncbi:MAG: PEP-CTERM sorting domain-containing protein [Pirellulales bacterium]|nr:PEP-CTERM sorting domain-containing protein [Pirellulales bacterium]
MSVLLLTAGAVQAETLLSIDFEGPTYSTGGIWGQDRWTQSYITAYLESQVGAGVGDNATQVFMGNSSTDHATSGAHRLHGSPLVFTQTDTAIVMTFWARSDLGVGYRENGHVALSMMWGGLSEPNYQGEHWEAVGMYFQRDTDTAPKTYFRDGQSTLHYGDALDADHWYEMKITMDLSRECSTPGTYGKLTYEYRDITDGDIGYTTDGSFVDADMFLTPDAFGQFKSNGIFAYVQQRNGFVQHQYLDNITVSIVPEPSALALLACGLIGLLAYAWRKRK